MRVPPLIANVGTVGGAPGQRQKIVVEVARLMLARSAAAAGVATITVPVAIGWPLRQRALGHSPNADQGERETDKTGACHEMAKHGSDPTDGSLESVKGGQERTHSRHESTEERTILFRTARTFRQATAARSGKSGQPSGRQLIEPAY